MHAPVAAQFMFHSNGRVQVTKSRADNISSAGDRYEPHDDGNDTSTMQARTDKRSRGTGPYMCY